MTRRHLLQGGIGTVVLGSPLQPDENASRAALATATAHVLALVKQMRPGDLRKSCERDWRPDGGIQVSSPVQYCLKACRNIKIDVEFRQVDVTRSLYNPDDILVRVSKPYLEYAYYD